MSIIAMVRRWLPLLSISAVALSLINSSAQERSPENEDSRSFDALVSLLQDQEHSRAADWLRKDWEAFDWLNGNETPPDLSPLDASALPSLLTKLGPDDEELALYAEALLGALPDLEASRDLNPRRSRLSSLAKRLESYSWKDAKLKHTVLSYVGEDAVAASHLTESFRRAAPALSLAHLHEIEPLRERHCQQRLLQVYLRQSLVQGPMVYQTHLEQVLRLDSPETKQSLADLLLANLENAFLEDWHRWEKDTLRANLALFPLATDLDSERWLPLGWTIALLADDRSSLVIPARIRRAKSVPETARAPADLFLGAVMMHLNAATARAGLDDEALTQLAIQLSHNRLFMNALAHRPPLHQNWFTHLTHRSWMSKEALVKHAASFAKEAPRQGWAWLEAAHVYQNAKMPAEALTCWDEAVKHAGKDPNRYSLFRLSRIKQLLELNRRDDALRALKAFNQKLLHPDYEEQFERLEKRLRPRPRGPATAV